MKKEQRRSFSVRNEDPHDEKKNCQTWPAPLGRREPPLAAPFRYNRRRAAARWLCGHQYRQDRPRRRLIEKNNLRKIQRQGELAEAVLNHLLENMWEHLTLCAEGESRVSLLS